MRITVSRPPADKQGVDIVDSLLTSDSPAISRGTREIDYHSTNRSVERGNCVLLPYMPIGSLINVTELDGVYRGKLKSYALTIDISEDNNDFTVTTSISIEREMR